MREPAFSIVLKKKETHNWLRDMGKAKNFKLFKSV